MKRSWFTPWRARRGAASDPSAASAPLAAPDPSVPSAKVVCREAVELVTAYLDDALDPAARDALERHLADCPHCDEYFAQIQLVRRTAAHVEPVDLAPEARDDLMALYRRWSAEQGRTN